MRVLSVLLSTNAVSKVVETLDKIYASRNLMLNKIRNIEIYELDSFSNAKS